MKELRGRKIIEGKLSAKAVAENIGFYDLDNFIDSIVNDTIDDEFCCEDELVDLLATEWMNSEPKDKLEFIIEIFKEVIKEYEEKRLTP